MKPNPTCKSTRANANHPSTHRKPARPRAPLPVPTYFSSFPKRLLGGLLLCAFSLVGCQSTFAPFGPDAIRNHPIARVPLDPDIVQVKKFFEISPWLSFDPNDSRKPGGFKVVVYLISAKTQRGAFGDGVIHIVMSLAETDPNDPRAKHFREVRRWSYDPQQALLYRAKKKTVLGYGYQLRCNWEDTDVLGKEIAIHVEFERKDGRILTSQPNYLRPPMR